MAAAQPFISGAISKTVNMPNEATIEDIEDCYFEAAKIGVKAIAIYRDGSKASQPLSSSSDDGDSEESDPEVTKILEEEAMLIQGNFAPGTSPSIAYAGINRPRFLLPERREGPHRRAVSTSVGGAPGVHGAIPLHGSEGTIC